MKFGEWLKKTGMTQRECAEWMKVSQPTVSMWITGRRKPSREQIAQIDRRSGGQVTLYDFYDVPRRRRDIIRQSLEPQKRTITVEYTDGLTVIHKGFGESP
jgi:predicted transcriptional regulator